MAALHRGVHARIRHARPGWLTEDPAQVAARYRAGEGDVMDALRRYGVLLNLGHRQTAPAFHQADRAGSNRHGGAITSFCLRLPGPLDWHAFGLWFSMLAHRHGDKLLRVKGILHVEDSKTPAAIHAVQHVIHVPEHLPGWPDAERGSRIMFITQGLERDAVERSLHVFHRLK